jgi:hypothetical protein
MPSLDEIADELYQLPLDEFVAARDRYATQARADADRQLAGAIRGLRKPTLPAWLTNLVAWRRPDLVESWLELADQLRLAQEQRQGGRLRDLSGQRTKLISTILAEVPKLAVQAGRSGGAVPLDDVSRTLTAALADPSVAEQLRAGRLVAPAEYAGLGPAPLPGQPVTDVRDRPAAAGDPPPRPSGQSGQPAPAESPPQPIMPPDPAALAARAALADAFEAERAARALVDDLEEQYAAITARLTAARRDAAQASRVRREAARHSSRLDPHGDPAR